MTRMSAEREVVGLNPGRANNHHPSSIGQIEGDVKEPTLLF